MSKCTNEDHEGILLSMPHFSASYSQAKRDKEAGYVLNNNYVFSFDFQKDLSTISVQHGKFNAKKWGNNFNKNPLNKKEKTHAYKNLVKLKKIVDELVIFLDKDVACIIKTA